MSNENVINNSEFAGMPAACPITKIFRSWAGFLLLTFSIAIPVIAAPDPLQVSGEEIAVFHFDTDEGGVASDSLDSGATCTLGSETRWVKNGKSGGAIEFLERKSPLGPLSSVVRLPDSATHGESFGISFWFLIPSQVSMDQNLFFVSSDFLYIRWVASRRALEFGLKSPETGNYVGISSTIEQVAGASWKSETLEGSWFQFTGTYDGEKMRMYLDGVLLGEADLKGPLRGLGQLSLGCQFWEPDPASPNQFVGILDELRFFTPKSDKK
jgi:hypothetical protein